MNPALELSYWRFGLQTAQAWRERLGLERNPKWDEILDHLSPLPMHEGLYQNAETALDTFSEPANRRDHPALLGAFGMIPNPDVDRTAMKKTLQAVMQSWNWESTWGWDFPLMAMTAARVGEPDLAMDALLMDVAEEYVLEQRSQLPERSAAHLSAGERRLADGRRPDGGRLGRRSGHRCPGFPAGRELDGQVRGIAEAALISRRTGGISILLVIAGPTWLLEREDRVG